MVKLDTESFRTKLSEHGINLSAKQLDQFSTYFKQLVEWNEKINLTAITNKPDVYLKHFFDSITAAFYYDFTQEAHICDVGAGAGFPSLPLKICFPHLKITIVDSLKKRINFLNQLAEHLELSDVSFYHDRAELFGRQNQHRESYDIVMARAVARTSVLSELCLPLVKQGGDFIAMKGPNAESELDDANKAISLLGAEVKAIHTFDLPDDNGERHIVLMQKVKKTPGKYPRKPGVPNKTPL